jgi:hypothetical protein
MTLKSRLKKIKQRISSRESQVFDFTNPENELAALRGITMESVAKICELERSITEYEPGMEPSPEEEKKKRQEDFSRIQKRIEELEKLGDE